MSILDYVQAGKNTRALGICVYGEAGTGKTTFASHFPKPLFLDTEQGSDHIDVPRLRINVWADFIAAIKELEELAAAGQLPYKTIVIDTLDHLWNMAGDYIVSQDPKKKTLQGFGFNAGYVLASDEFKAYFAILKRIVLHGVNVALICHARIEEITPPDAATYAHYCPKINPPNKQANASRDFVQEWVDGIYFINCEVTVDAENKKAFGGQERILHTQAQAAWVAKSRVDLPAAMPLTADSAAAIFSSGAPAAKPEQVEVGPAQEEHLREPAQMADEPARGVDVTMNTNDDSVLYKYLVATGKVVNGQPLNTMANYQGYCDVCANEGKKAALAFKARNYFNASPEKWS